MLCLVLASSIIIGQMKASTYHYWRQINQWTTCKDAANWRSTQITFPLYHITTALSNLFGLGSRFRWAIFGLGYTTQLQDNVSLHPSNDIELGAASEPGRSGQSGLTIRGRECERFLTSV